MASAIEQVTEFRDIVETTIAGSLEGQIGTWPDMHEYAKVHDFSYVSVDPTDARISTVGLGPEHRWGIVSDHQRIGKYTGSIALVSLGGKEDSLVRRVDIKSPMGAFLSIDSERELVEVDELDLALNWARSPHLFPRNIMLLGRLSPAEQEKVSAEYTRLEHDAAELQADLEAIRLSRFRSARNASRHFIR
jgi:hypothetical protein